MTKDYYAKREIEISTQLGSEAMERAQSQNAYESQKQKEELLRDQLDKVKQQVADLKGKWEDDDNKHAKLISDLEERKNSNYMALMEVDRHGL